MFSEQVTGSCRNHGTITIPEHHSFQLSFAYNTPCSISMCEHIHVLTNGPILLYRSFQLSYVFKYSIKHLAKSMCEHMLSGTIKNYLDLQQFSVYVVSLVIPSRLAIFQPARPAVHQSELDIFPGSTALYTSAAHTVHCLSGSSSVVPVKEEKQSISHTANISIVMLGISRVV